MRISPRSLAETGPFMPDPENLSRNDGYKPFAEE
jgi:hypothetical protein